MELKDRISTYKDFPKKGILFRDFSPLLADPQAMSYVVDEITKKFHENDFDLLVGIESRGFILASAIGARLGKGMVMIRKAGKLPGKTIKNSYSIEYGKDVIEIQNGALKKGQRVLLCDDLLATGGTANAAAKLVGKTGAKILGFAFIIELTDLGGRKKINHRCESLVKY